MNNILATRWIFFLQPLVLGAWFPRIPQMQALLDLGAGQLAIALMGMPLGLLAALSIGGKLSEWLGTRRLLTAAFVAQTLCLPLPSFATSGVLLFGFLAVAGLALALAELGLNVTASEVEARAGRHIMNVSHGCWSIGVLCGSAIGSLCAAWHIAPNHSLIAVGFVSAIPAIWIARQITNFAVVPSSSDEPTKRGISKGLIFISLFAFGVAMSEGAMADWSAVYFTEIFAATPGVAGASYTIFALCVAIGRFQGDHLKARFDVAVLGQSFALLALAGLLVLICSNSATTAFIGISLFGLGLSIGFPVAVSAASVLPGRSSAGNVAVLTQMTLCGFLIGPPMIGFVAEHSSMRGGLAALVPVLGMALYFARHLSSSARTVSP